MKKSTLKVQEALDGAALGVAPSGLAVSIEVTEWADIQRVHLWSKAQRGTSGGRRLNNTRWPDNATELFGSDAIQFQIKPEGGIKIPLLAPVTSNTSLTPLRAAEEAKDDFESLFQEEADDEFQLDNIQVITATGYEVEVFACFFVHEAHLFARVLDDYLPLDADKATIDLVQGRGCYMPEKKFLDWLKELKRTPESRPATDTDESLCFLPNGKADRVLHRSLMLFPQEWQTNKNLANFYHDGRDGHTVVYQPSEVELALGDAPARALDLLDQRFAKIKNETVSDVIDILFYHWNAHKDGQIGAVPINAAKLCQYRGKVPDGENLRLHWEALRDAFALTLRDRNSDINARVFNADSRGENQDGPSARYVYRPGIFLEFALRDEPLYFAPFLQKVWALDPTRHNEAKRLARYLRSDWRMNTEKYLESGSGKARAARWHSWAFLLAETGIDVEIHRKSKNPKRLIEMLKRAVEKLYELEVIAEGDFDIYHPDDRKTAENLPPRGALDAWLALRVCLAPAAKLREALLETDNKRRAGKARDAKATATERAKKRLRSAGDARPQKRKS